MMMGNIIVSILSLIKSGSLTNRLMTSLFILALISCVPKLDKDDHIEVGTVVEKTAIGFADGDSVLLIDAIPGDVKYRVGEIRDLVSSAEGNVTLSEEAEEQLRSTYSEIQYRVKVRLCIRRTTEEYTLSRESFNALHLDIIAKVLLNPEETAIDSLIEY